MYYTQSVGNVVELQCISKFVEMGFECSIPYGNSARYDFIVDVNGNFLRIQCKSSSYAKKDGEIDYNAFTFNAQSATTNTKKTVRHNYTKEEIDYFATYFNEQVYLIPVEQCSTSKTLRYAPPQNNSSNYNKAEDYEIEKIIQSSEDFLKSKEEYEKSKIPNQKQIKKYFCKQCGKEITKYSDSGLCYNCHAKTTRLVERPTREELKQMIRNIPFTQIGKQYGVSDNSIKKWCITENLPYKKSEIKKISDEDWSNI